MNTPTHTAAAARGDLTPRPINHYEGTDRSAAGMIDDLASWQASAPGRRTAGPASDFTRQAVSELQSVPGMVAAARAEAERLHGDDTLPADARRRLLSERTAKLEADIQAAQERARRLAEQARSEYTVAALGQVPKADQLAAREDLKIFLAGVAPADVPARVADLARRGDHVGQLAAGNVGRMLIEASGADQSTVARYQRVAQANGVQAAAASSDPARAQAAAQALHLARLGGTLDWPASLGRIATGELRRRTGLPEPPT